MHCPFENRLRRHSCLSSVSSSGSVHVYEGNATEVTLNSLATNTLWQISVAALQTVQELDKVGPVDVWLGWSK